ncbi:MAG: cytochrome b/b6 domain-containing protein [Terriglobales bacterium]
MPNEEERQEPRQNREEADAEATKRDEVVEAKESGGHSSGAASEAASGGEERPVEAVVAKMEMVAEEPEPAAESEEEPERVRAAYEHPLAIRITHWVNAISLFVMIASGLRIFRAFPSFGPKIPEKVLIDVPNSLTLGGWLGGALQWHFTFMWFFAASGIFYVVYQAISGHFRTLLFMPRDVRGVWPMVRHYFLFGPKPMAEGQYNPLQKLAYTAAIGFGALSLLTGIVLYKPTQFSWLAFLFGGFHLTRIWHFASMCGFLAFIPGHLIMVAAHGWSNFYSMLSGWKREPEYQD